ncbi:MAG: hypothetical protein R3B09_29480 [Nannocystaceae bacterium]
MALSSPHAARGISAADAGAITAEASAGGRRRAGSSTSGRRRSPPFAALLAAAAILGGIDGIDGIRGVQAASPPAASPPAEETPTPVEGPASTTRETPTPVEGPASTTRETPTPVEGRPASSADPEATAEEEAPAPRRRGSTRARRFLFGLEGVAMLTPSIQPRILELDRRYVGPTTTLGGVGVFGRWRAVPWLSLDVGVRSGSLRLRKTESGDLISQDLFLAEVGALLYLARGEIGQLALDGGLGGLVHQIGYARGDGSGSGTQRVGAALFRVGLDIELLLTRIAFVISLRAYGVVTDRKRTVARGDLFDGVDAAGRQAPVPTFQTYVIGTGGLAYRF